VTVLTFHALDVCSQVQLLPWHVNDSIAAG
jgi:hypothetical protein